MPSETPRRQDALNCPAARAASLEMDGDDMAEQENLFSQLTGKPEAAGAFVPREI